MPDFDQISYALHQLFFGWFEFYPTLALVCVGSLGTFAVAAKWNRKALIFAIIGAIIVTMPQLIPLTSSLMLLESRAHGVSILGNLRVMQWLVIGSELMWWPPVALAYWLGKRAYRLSRVNQGRVFE